MYENPTQVWLKKEVFPLLLDLCDENAIFTQQKIVMNDNFKNVPQNQEDFLMIIEKVIKLRPSKWIVLKQLCDEIKQIINYNIFQTQIIKNIFSECKKKYIKSMIADDLQYFQSKMPTFEIPIDFLKFESEEAGYPKAEITENNELSIILLSALFGSYNIFDYFFNKSDFLQIKSNISKDLVIYSIIGGNHRIIQTLNRLNFEIKEYIYVSIIFHRNDIFIWLMNQFESNINMNHVFELSKEKLNFELLDQLGYSEEENSIENPRKKTKKDQRGPKQLKRRGSRPRNY